MAVDVNDIPFFHERYYGCGLVIPEKLEGVKVLDLGSGSGRDCFALSKLVGASGHVTGIDMTDEQVFPFFQCSKSFKNFKNKSIYDGLLNHLKFTFGPLKNLTP